MKTLEMITKALEQYPRTMSYAGVYGCDKDTTILTTDMTGRDSHEVGPGCKEVYLSRVPAPEDAKSYHANHILRAIRNDLGEGRVMFVRKLPEVSTDEDGNTWVRTRLQFGDKDKVTYPDKIDLPVNKEENPMQCDKCIHKSVCCHRDEYRALVAKVDAPAHPFKVTVECSEFRLVQPVVRNPQMYPHEPTPMNPQWHSPGPTCTERMEGTAIE